MTKRTMRTGTATVCVAALATTAAAIAAMTACSNVLSVPEVTSAGDDAATGAVDTGSTPAGDTGAPPASDGAVDGTVADSAADSGVDAVACVADAATDPHNCGRCGHDCQGGACKASVCQPFELFPTRPGPFFVAVDDTRIYWGDRADDQILSANKDDGSDLKVLADGQAGGVAAPWAIVVDATHLYWANGLDQFNGGSIRRIPLVNSTGAGEIVADAEYPRSLAMAGANLYFTEHEAARVLSIPKTATSGTPTLIGSTGGAAEQIVVDDTNVYWSDSFRFPDVGARVVRAPRTGRPDGGVAAIIAGDQVDLFGLAQDATNVYWTINSGPPSPLGAVRSAAKTAVNGAGVQIVATSNNPTFVTVSNGEIFWAEQGNWVSISDSAAEYDYPHGRLLACKLPSCAGGPRVIATEQPNMQNIVATSDALYWADYGLTGASGKIMKVVR